MKIGHIIKELFRDKKTEEKVSQINTSNPIKKDVAVFIDIENFESAQNIDVLLKAITSNNSGKNMVIYAYADWKRIDAATIKFLKESFVDMKDVHNGVGYYAHMKNSADIALSCDAIEYALINRDTERFILATGDSGFINLVYKLKDYGKHVSLISLESKTNQNLVLAVDDYRYVKEYGKGSQNAIKLEFSDLQKQQKEYSRFEKNMWAILKKNASNHDNIWLAKYILNSPALISELESGLDLKILTKTIKKAYHEFPHKRDSMIKLINEMLQRECEIIDGIFYKKAA
ncbi:MAG: NYN domain-containing protein [Campylobacterales bacterium]|nr:NYN domain-containing protein [Campylobacterales bacterium]